MSFEKIMFKDIYPSDYNPRKMNKNDLNTLSRNLNEFGLVDPIIINLKNNHIVGGHQRYRALSKKYNKDNIIQEKEMNLIKLGDIGWVFEDENLEIKDEQYEKAVNISLNKVSGEWDYGKLSTLLTNLQLTGFNTNLTGFSKFEIEKYTIPSELRMQFDEIKQSENKVSVQNNSHGTNDEEQTQTTDKEIVIDDEYPEDEYMESTSEQTNVVETYDHICPNCGYEW